MARQVSEERKAAFYIGTGLVVMGFLVFGSNFLFVMGFIDRGPSPNDSGFNGFMMRAFVGAGLIAVGNFIRRIGARGVAGSGLTLDPEQAREDLEPYSRMAGGMVQDALDEANIDLNRDEPEKVVMLKCQSCGKLNDEDSKFCQECGKPF